MPIQITVEDGTNVVNANSYISVEDARSYAINRGIELPVDDDALAAMLIQAMDYIESKACQFQGYPTFEDQELSFPRTDVYINNKLLGENTIPKQLKGAQVQLAITVNKGIELMPTITVSDYIVEDTVGPLTTKYADPTKIGLGDLSPSMTAVDALLAPLFSGCEPCVGFSLRTVRV